MAQHERQEAAGGGLRIRHEKTEQGLPEAIRAPLQDCAGQAAAPVASAAEAGGADEMSLDLRNLNRPQVCAQGQAEDAASDGKHSWLAEEGVLAH